MADPVTEVARRYQAVQQQLEATVAAAGRPPGAVQLLAVSKRHPPPALAAAYAAGARAFGENYVQEALGKMDDLPADARWHLIGPLQTNKAKRAAEAFHCVQTLDRPSLATALERAVAARDGRLDVLLQVNVAAEASKSGATPEDAETLVCRLAEWPHLRLCGLMTIPPYDPDPELTRPHFRALRLLREHLAALAPPGVALTELSMGMSHDFPVAVQEGATIVRVGTAIFGERQD